ncbi:MAG: phosphoribosylformylglycinamidine synthase I [Thaumarchaeota archaeon]|nr:phosphoribosylformylglycinamidine synthase I [Nitrososphaerota archaeon]
MKVAIIRFPGTNCDFDAYHVLKNVLHLPSDLIWHEEVDLRKYDGVILPGGFSYGDHLRAGIIAAHSPAMTQVKKAAEEGKPILGICNGFQILAESELLPGALLRNAGLRFVCKWVNLRVDSTSTFFTSGLKKGTLLRMPIAHGEGRYFLGESEIKNLERKGQIVFRYVDEKGNTTENSNPNGSLFNIAGVSNEKGNVVGLMPHPERASEKILSPFGSSDGLAVLGAFAKTVEVMARK